MCTCFFAAHNYGTAAKHVSAVRCHARVPYLSSSRADRLACSHAKCNVLHCLCLGSKGWVQSCMAQLVYGGMLQLGCEFVHVLLHELYAQRQAVGPPQ